MKNDTSREKDILLAEDDKDDVLFFDMALKELDMPHVLRHAENGDVLFVLLKEKLPYILFLDIYMPCKDGLACIAEIRRNKEFDSLPVIMYTSNLSKRIVEQCFRSGANLYVTKAESIKSLAEKLRKVFAVDWDEYLHYPPQEQFMLS